MLSEAFRVLKPGGRFAVSDIVTRGAIPEHLRRDMLLWAGCSAGALDEDDYRAKLAAAGFEAVDIEATRVYDKDDVAEMASSSCCASELTETLAGLEGSVMSAFRRASCCGFFSLVTGRCT